LISIVLDILETMHFLPILRLLVHKCGKSLILLRFSLISLSNISYNLRGTNVLLPLLNLFLSNSCPSILSFWFHCAKLAFFFNLFLTLSFLSHLSIYLSIYLLFTIFFKGRVFLCSPGWPRTPDPLPQPPACWGYGAH
jgi:hypothetical protein